MEVERDIERKYSRKRQLSQTYSTYSKRTLKNIAVIFLLSFLSFLLYCTMFTPALFMLLKDGDESNYYFPHSFPTPYIL